MITALITDPIDNIFKEVDTLQSAGACKRIEHGCIEDTLQHNICISNRSKLRAERTNKSLARNSQVLSGFCYVSYTQWVMRIGVLWR